MTSNEVRYGFQEGEIDNLEIEEELTYPNHEEASANDPLAPEPFATKPSIYFVREKVGLSRVDKCWNGDSVNLYSEGARSDNDLYPKATPILVRGENTRRSRIVFWINGTVANVKICDALGNGMFLPPGEPLELYSTGAFYAASIADAGTSVVLNVYEESFK